MTTDQTPETDEQRADREETEQAHASGDHEYCGVTCEVEFPTEMLRNGILAKGYPGTAGMLDELLRRAAVSVAAPPTQAARAEALLLHFTAEAHRRKWSYDRGLDDDGVPIKSEAFGVLHRLGEEMRVALEKLRSLAVLPAPVDRAAKAEAYHDAADEIEARQARIEHEERDEHGDLDHETELQGAAVRDMARYLRERAAHERADHARRLAEAPQPETQAGSCGCGHAVDEHSVYGCVDGCGCEWMPKRSPMDPARILGIDACPTPLTHNWGCGCPTDQAPAVVAQPGKEPCGECPHPKHAHRDGDDPVTPGTCTACPPDEARHDWRAQGTS